MNDHNFADGLFRENIDNIKFSLSTAFNIPYYKRLFEEIKLDINKINSYEDFIKIPILTKNTYRENSIDFLNQKYFDDGFDIKTYNELQPKEKLKYIKGFKLSRYNTSGSTGIPLRILKSHSDISRCFFYLNMHRKKFFPSIFDSNNRFVWFWPANPLIMESVDISLESKEKYKIIKSFNYQGFQYFVYEFSDETFSRIIEFLKNNKITWIIGSPSMLSHFSLYIIRNNINVDYIKYIECHSEYLFDHQRENIKNAFHINPVSIYSSNEIDFIAGECVNENMHVFGVNVFVELIKNNLGINEVILTSLNYKDMPLIRYQIGDTAEWADYQCKCTNKNPIIKVLGHRSNDLIIMPNNVYYEPWILTDLMKMLNSNFNLVTEQYQIIQEDFYTFKFILKVANSNLLEIQNAIYEYVYKYLCKLLSNEIELNIIYVNEIIQNDEISGKFKYFITKLKIHAYPGKDL